MRIAPRNLRLAGSIVLSIGLSLSFLWCYWLLPLRKVNNLAWLEAHSPTEQWLEIQKQLRRTGLDHDSTIAIGRFGDKEWMEWIVKKLKSGHAEHDCGHGQMHLPDAPFKITNQRLADGANWTT